MLRRLLLIAVAAYAVTGEARNIYPTHVREKVLYAKEDGSGAILWTEIVEERPQEDSLEGIKRDEAKLAKARLEKARLKKAR